MSDNNLYCPIRAVLPGGAPAICLNTDCAWWSIHKECCAILSISNSLIVLRTTRQSMNTQLYKEL